MQIPIYQEQIRQPVQQPVLQPNQQRISPAQVVASGIQSIAQVGVGIAKAEQQRIEIENQKVATNEYNNAFRDWKESYLAWEREELDNAYQINPETGKPRYHDFSKDFKQFQRRFWERKSREFSSEEAKQKFEQRMLNDVVSYNDRLERSSDALVEKKSYDDMIKNLEWAASNGNPALVDQYLESYRASGLDADYDALRDEYEYKAYYANTRSTLMEMASAAGYEEAIGAVRDTSNFPDLEESDRHKLAKDIESEYLRIQREIERVEKEEATRQRQEIAQQFDAGELTSYQILHTQNYKMLWKHQPGVAERYLAMIEGLEENEKDPVPEEATPNDQEKNNFEADILSLIYSQAKPNEEIEQMIIQGQRKGFVSGGTARTLLGKNMSENPNVYMKEAANIMRNTFKEEPEELAKAMDFLIEQARTLTYDKKGKVGSQFKQEDIVQLAKNYVEPEQMKKIGKVMQNEKLFGLINTFNAEESAIRNVWDKDFLGTVETGPVLKAVANGFTEDFIEDTMLAGKDRKDLTKLEQQHLDNNIRIAQLGQAHKTFFQETFNEEPQDIGILQNGATTFQDRFGTWWTVKATDDAKDERWYMWKHNSWILSENPMIDRGQEAQEYTKSKRGAIP